MKGKTSDQAERFAIAFEMAGGLFKVTSHAPNKN